MRSFGLMLLALGTLLGTDRASVAQQAAAKKFLAVKDTVATTTGLPATIEVGLSKDGTDAKASISNLKVDALFPTEEMTFEEVVNPKSDPKNPTRLFRFQSQKEGTYGLALWIDGAGAPSQTCNVTVKAVGAAAPAAAKNFLAVKDTATTVNGLVTIEIGLSKDGSDAKASISSLKPQVLGMTGKAYLQEIVNPNNDPKNPTRLFQFQAPKEGTYGVAFWVTGTNSLPQVSTITVAAAAATPMSAAAKPDDQLATADVPAGMDEDLLWKFRDAVSKDVAKFGTAQKAHAAKLAALYSKIAGEIERRSDTVSIAEVSTQLHEAVIEAQIPRTDRGLTNTRGVIASLEFDRFDETVNLKPSTHSKRVFVGLLQTAGSYLAVATQEPKKDTK